MKEQDLQLLQQFFDSLHPLSEDIWRDLVQHWQEVRYKRKVMLTTAGQTERYLYFVLEGIQRAYYIHPQGDREATLVFTYPPSLSGIADSFLTQSPSLYYLETLTNSRMLRMSYTTYAQLQVKYPELQAWALQLCANALQGILLRQAEIQCFTAEEKFRALLTRSPHMLQLVPHKYLASYLAIDPSTFSRLLATVKL